MIKKYERCVFVIQHKTDNKYLKQCKNCKINFWDTDDNLDIICVCTKPFAKIPNKPLNFAKALVKFIASSIWHLKLQYVTGTQYKERLEICDPCDYRHPEKPECMICKCRLTAIFNKAQLKTEKCPLGKWPILYESDTIQVSE